ncbi:hypothetical protein HN51_055146, partial [Arachis hypogaea]
FRLSVSVSAQQSTFAVGVLSDLYAFHRSTGTSPSIRSNRASRSVIIRLPLGNPKFQSFKVQA